MYEFILLNKNIREIVKMKVVGIPELNKKEMISCLRYISRNKEETDKEIEKYMSGGYMRIKSSKELMRTLNNIKQYASTDFERIVINKLIGDRKLHKKIAFISDGSFVNNRIAILNCRDDYNNLTEEKINFIEFISSELLYNNGRIKDDYGYTKEELKIFREKFKSLPLKKKIIAIYNSFDHIFIHWN